MSHFVVDVVNVTPPQWLVHPNGSVISQLKENQRLGTSTSIIMKKKGTF